MNKLIPTPARETSVGVNSPEFWIRALPRIVRKYPPVQIPKTDLLINNLSFSKVPVIQDL